MMPGSKLVEDVSPESFVRAWEASKDIDDLLRRTGLSRADAVKLGWRLRKIGVDLKPLVAQSLSRRGRKPRYDVDALNQAVRSARKKIRK